MEPHGCHSSRKIHRGVGPSSCLSQVYKDAGHPPFLTVAYTISSSLPPTFRNKSIPTYFNTHISQILVLFIERIVDLDSAKYIHNTVIMTPQRQYSGHSDDSNLTYGSSAASSPALRSSDSSLSLDSLGTPIFPPLSSAVADSFG